MGIRLNNTLRVINYLKEASDTARTIADIQFALRLSYPTIRRIITEYSPECFREVEGIGWYLTGVNPLGLKELPKFHNVIQHNQYEVPATGHERERVEKPISTGKWQWSQPAINWLDHAKERWPDKPLSEILNAADSKQLLEMEIVAKTWLHAIQEKKRTGRNSF